MQRKFAPFGSKAVVKSMSWNGKGGLRGKILGSTLGKYSFEQKVVFSLFRAGRGRGFLQQATLLGGGHHESYRQPVCKQTYSCLLLLSSSVLIIVFASDVRLFREVLFWASFSSMVVPCSLCFPAYFRCLVVVLHFLKQAPW